METLFRLKVMMVISLTAFIILGGISGFTYGENAKYLGSVDSVVYHYPYCPNAVKILDKNKVFFALAEDAVADGRHPCAICWPPSTDDGASAVSPASSQSAIKVTFNGALVTVDPPPFIENGRAYVPVRPVLEAYGVDSIGWEAPNVLVSKENLKLRIPVGQNCIYKNETYISTDTAAIIKNGRTCLPIRAVIEALDGGVNWNANKSMVEITGPGIYSSDPDASPTPPPKTMKVNFIDVGQGDSIFLELDDIDILIDAGDKSHGKDVVNYLQRAGVDDLELVIGTHPHADHIGGLPDVFGAFKIDRYIDSGTVTDSDIYKTLMHDVASEGCKYSSDEDEIIKYGNLTLQIIETGDNSKDLNDDSVVVLATYGTVKMLFAGDASSAVDDKLVGVGHVNLFKTKDHGSRTGNSASLLSALTPEIAVISYGVGNTYGHPHQEALDSMKKHAGFIAITAGRDTVITLDNNQIVDLKCYFQ